LRKIPGVTLELVTECCGHDGTYSMKVEGFEASQRVGKRSFDDMQAAGAGVVDRMPAGGAAVPAARRHEALSTALDPGARLPRRPVPGGRVRPTEGMPVKPVRREELVRLRHLAEQRAGAHAARLAAKALRRIHVGEHLTFLFENSFNAALADPGDDARREARARE
jgi:hypothetical protein